ncbi:hypothetical protein ACLM45_08365 [Synechococcus sp. A10-1-5-9]|uniref:hypothetical protein n=1 Tax=Synechococcus sp. A10-1-5-9 TaxID=3392295 RepID=UPI0039E99020
MQGTPPASMNERAKRLEKQEIRLRILLPPSACIHFPWINLICILSNTSTALRSKSTPLPIAANPLDPQKVQTSNTFWPTKYRLAFFSKKIAQNPTTIIKLPTSSPVSISTTKQAT